MVIRMEFRVEGEGLFLEEGMFFLLEGRKML